MMSHGDALYRAHSPTRQPLTTALQAFNRERHCMNILIQGGHVIDPASQLDTVADIAVADGKILAIGSVPATFTPEQTINASGCLVLPGLVDLAAHVGMPQHTQSAAFETELQVAAAAGVTTLVCPPDTEPVLDEPGLVEMLAFRAERANGSRLFPLGALTQQLQGETLAEMGALKQSGCVGFSQAEAPIQNTQVLLRAMQYAATFGYDVWLRPQDPWLSQGVAASGAQAMRMGLSGVPALAETVALNTFMALAESTGAKLHICKISSAASVEIIRQAKARGLPITCDVSINSLHLTEEEIGYFDSHARLSPPLRSLADKQALRTALKDGTIDALVSDHTPVGTDAKIQPFSDAAAGASGVELLLPLTLQWAKEDGIALPQALASVTHKAAAILNAQVSKHLQNNIGQIKAGGIADICVVQPDAPWTVNAQTLRSKGKFTPFEGKTMHGRVLHTLKGGQLLPSVQAN